MRERIANAIADGLYKHPGLIALVIVILVGLSFWQMSKLTINYNQLELIPQDLPSVLATKRMFKLAGGYGNLFIALRGKDVSQMKQVADDLTAGIRRIPEVRSATCRQDVSFLRDHLAYYIDIDDLNEAYGLMRKKIRALTREKLGMKSDDTETDKELNKLVDKYRNVNSKFVDDEYNIDPDREMILIVIQANGIPNNLDFSKKLLSDVSSVIEGYNRSNPRGVRLKENDGGVQDRVRRFDPHEECTEANILCRVRRHPHLPDHSFPPSHADHPAPNDPCHEYRDHIRFYPYYSG